MAKDFFQLPDDQCERMNRQEMVGMKWLLSALSSVAYGQDDLAKRLEMIPNGRKRYRLMLGQLRSISNDLVGTMKVGQCKQIKNVMNDMELRLVPKMTPSVTRVSLEADDLRYIVNQAKKETCLSCIKTDAECKTCEMYQILERIAPLDDYGDGSLCPYMREDIVE